MSVGRYVRPRTIRGSPFSALNLPITCLTTFTTTTITTATTTTSRGHPDAYTAPPPKHQVDIDVTGHVTPTAPTAAPANPPPAPTIKPSIIKKPRPSQNLAGAPPPKDTEEGNGGPYDDDEEPMNKEKKQAFTRFAALGLSVGAAVVCAIVSTLGVALYAHRLRQQGQLPQAEGAYVVGLRVCLCRGGDNPTTLLSNHTQTTPQHPHHSAAAGPRPAAARQGRQGVWHGAFRAPTVAVGVGAGGGRGWGV